MLLYIPLRNKLLLASLCSLLFSLNVPAKSVFEPSIGKPISFKTLNGPIIINIEDPLGSPSQPVTTATIETDFILKCDNAPPPECDIKNNDFRHPHHSDHINDPYYPDSGSDEVIIEPKVEIEISGLCCVYKYKSIKIFDGGDDKDHGVHNLPVGERYKRCCIENEENPKKPLIPNIITAADCPKFTTNLTDINGNFTICSENEPKKDKSNYPELVWEFIERNQELCSRCKGKCPKEECCDYKKSGENSKVKIPNFPDPTLPDIESCDTVKNIRKCEREGKKCLKIKVKAGPRTGEIECPCDCFPKKDTQNEILTNSFPDKENICSIDNPRACRCDNGSLVKFSNLIAKPSSKGISLNWTTKTEPDSQGFKIWRAIPNLNSYCGCSGNIDDYTQIQVLDKEGKPVLIPTKGTKTSGYDYSYLDKDAKPGIAYCYALEDVDSRGESKFYFEYVAFTQDNLEETQDNLEEIK